MWDWLSVTRAIYLLCAKNRHWCHTDNRLCYRLYKLGLHRMTTSQQFYCINGSSRPRIYSFRWKRWLQGQNCRRAEWIQTWQRHHDVFDDVQPNAASRKQLSKSYNTVSVQQAQIVFIILYVSLIDGSMDGWGLMTF